MTLLHRRILTLFLGLLLLAVSPLIILYAAGYRYNFEKFRIEKVGLLYVTTNPNDTKIQVNGQEKVVGKELVLRSIPPGEHEISLVNDGYHTWTKQLEIKRGQSTFITDHLLFLSEPAAPFELFTNPLEEISTSETEVIFQYKNFLFLYLVEEQSVFEFELGSETTITSALYDSTSKTVLFHQEELWKLLDTEAPLIKNLQTPDETHFVEELNGEFIAITSEGAFLVDTENQPSLLLEQPEIQSVLNADQGYWVIATNAAKTQSFLYQFLDTSSRPIFVDALPYSQEYSLDEDYRGLLSITDTANYILYLVDTTGDQAVTESLFGVQNYHWSKNHQELLTSTEFELTIHTFENGISQELLLRLSTPITSIAWHPEELHAFYVTNETLFIIERDERDLRNTIQLTEPTKNLTLLGTDPTSVQFYSHEGLSTAFWKRYIHEE